MENIGEILKQQTLGITKSTEISPDETKKNRAKTERGAILVDFFHKLSPYWLGKGDLKITLLSIKVRHLTLKDLYYLKSLCESEERRGSNYAKVFWGSLKPR